MYETYDALLLHDLMQLLHTGFVQSYTRIFVSYIGLYIKECTRQARTRGRVPIKRFQGDVLALPRQ